MLFKKILYYLEILISFVVLTTIILIMFLRFFIFMLDLPFDKIVEKIVSATSTSKENVLKLIEDKKAELQGLVSDEGAAFIIANEKGVSFIPAKSEDFVKIKDLVAGLKFVNIVGRVINIFPVREFEGKTGKGTVVNFLFGDDSGLCKVVLWNDFTRLISEERIVVGDVLKVIGAYTKKDNQDRPEIHISSRSRIAINPEGIKVPELASFKKPSNADAESFLGSVTYIFPQVSFFDVCPSCNRKVIESRCATHNVVSPKKSMVLSFNLDDGINSFRCISFGDISARLFGKSVDSLFSEFEKEKSLDASLTSLRKMFIGRVVIVSGRLQVNETSNRPEIIISDVNLQPSPEILASDLINEIKN